MSMIAIELSSDIKGVRVPDENGVSQTFDLNRGWNDVPATVADHWYVRKFIMTVKKPRVVVVPATEKPVEMTAAAKSETAAPASEKVATSPTDVKPSAPAKADATK